MLRRTGFIVLALSCATLFAACGDDSTGPEGYDWSGTWTGTVEDATFGPGTVQLTLTQTDDRLDGTGTLVLGILNVSGNATGTATDSQIQLTVAAQQPILCSLSMTGTRTGDTMAGTYAPAICPVAVGGTFSLAKQ